MHVTERNTSVESREAFNKMGLDYDEIIDEIQATPEKFDAMWDKAQDMAQELGLGCVPNK